MSTSAPYGISFDTTSLTFAPLTDPVKILQQWVTLQLQTRLGFFWSAPEAGCDVTTYILKGLTPAALAAIGPDIESTLGADQRIAQVAVTPTVAYTAVGSAQLNLAIVVTPLDPNLAPFSLAAVATAALANQITQGLGV